MHMNPKKRALADIRRQPSLTIPWRKLPQDMALRAGRRISATLQVLP